MTTAAFMLLALPIGSLPIVSAYAAQALTRR